MNIVYFLTYGYSLKTWNDSSALDREAKYFNYLSDKHGIKFYIVTYGDESDLIYSDMFTNSKIIPIYKYKKLFNIKLFDYINSLTFAKKIEKLISENIDIIKQNQLLGFWISYMYKKKINNKLFLRTGYDMYLFSIHDKKNIIKKKLYKYLTNFGLRFSDIYTVSSISDFDFLNKSFNFKEDKLKILRNWIDSNEYLEINNREEAFVSVGRLEYQKNYEYLIKEISNLRRPLTIYGEGSEKNNLKNLSSQLNVQLQIKKNIPNKNLINELKKIKYFIIPSYFEGNPKSLLEAMSVGCVVFASNIKNHSEIISHGEDGFLFDLKDDSLKNQLTQVINNEEVSNKNIDLISQNAVKKINKNYAMEIIAIQEMKIISEVIDER